MRIPERSERKSAKITPIERNHNARHAPRQPHRTKHTANKRLSRNGMYTCMTHTLADRTDHPANKRIFHYEMYT